MSEAVAQAIASGLLLGSVYALFSAGLTLVWGMMGVINFAHGDFVMLGMFVAFAIVGLVGSGFGAFVPLTAIALAVIGVLAYFLIVRPISKGPVIAQSLGTFGLALLIRYSVFMVFGPDIRTLPSEILAGTVSVGTVHIELSRLLAGLVGLVLTVGFHLFLVHTSIGSRMMAVAEDTTAAQLMGIRPSYMQALAWGLAGAATGIAGALIATFFPISPMSGQVFLLIAFVTVTLGGFGSVLGALLGGLVIGLVQSLSAVLISPIYENVIVYALFIFILWIRPQGFLGISAQ
ncbi:MAG: branched-chain amino acid ABC transporter permease [Rhodanobacteraceae bacterium]